ncbi:MAG: right-handed parallel beta-helix repeat-containing protein [Phycisphaerales bacterium]|nr:right-handed parallel beta-helix repeat-containing protein [Phycisphaerales bacterium]
MKIAQPRLALSLVLAASATASGQTITVNTVEDTVDFGGAQTVAQLPGPDGKVSMREACAAANNTPGPQTIAFAIPTSEWWLLTNVALLKNESNAFFLTDDETTVDFTTQTAFTGDTNPNGNEVAIYGLHPSFLGSPGIWIFGNRCTIKGLGYVYQRGYGIQIQGNDNRVIGCVTDGGLYAAVYITGGFGGQPPHGNIIGGTGPGEGNWLISGNTGVRIDDPANDNIVIGNFLSGSASGVEVRGNPFSLTQPTNNRIGGPTPVERNIISGAGHYGEEGFPTGVQVDIERATGTIIEGNYIGTTADGSAPFPRQTGPGGIVVRTATGTVIRDNLISGLLAIGVNHYAGQRFGVAIAIQGASPGTAIHDNLIGTDATGLNPVTTRSGITAAFFPGEGSPTSADIRGNTIAFTELDGVLAESAATGIRLSGNSIHDNGGLGIDLLPSSGVRGVTPNDPLDADAGGNGLQNFPVLATAAAGPGPVHITGTLDSTPSTAFTLEFFASPACDPSGFGEGAAYLGSTDVSTDSAGHTEFDISLPATIAPGSFITATAARALSGDTSEFSACIAVATADCPADLTGDGIVDFADYLEFLNRYDALDPSVDFTGDGLVDFADYLEFLNLYEQGC